MLFFPNWKDKGIEQIKDIISENENRILTLEEIQNKIDYGRANATFQCLALVNSLPDTWLRWIQNGERQTEYPICEAEKFNCKPKFIKKLLRDQREIITPIASTFWTRKFGIEINEKTWENAILHTKETRLRVLQWKILHNIYPTNILLNKMNVTENNKCSYCPYIVDYLENFFFDCTEVQSMWKFVEQKFLLETNVIINQSATDVLFWCLLP